MDIPKTMMAVVKTKRERGAEYLQVPVPEVGPDEALIKVHATAICGTDIHAYQWNAWAQNNFERSFSKLPRIMGHEFSGEVIVIGDRVSNIILRVFICGIYSISQQILNRFCFIICNRYFFAGHLIVSERNKGKELIPGFTVNRDSSGRCGLINCKCHSNRC